MGTFTALVSVIGAVAAWCAMVLIRRGRRGPTENTDGLLIEQAARLRAQQLRSEGRDFRAHPYARGSSDPGLPRY